MAAKCFAYKCVAHSSFIIFLCKDVTLTSEQQECLLRAREGHNFLIFGEAGTGKSKVVVEICDFNPRILRSISFYFANGNTNTILK